MVNIFDSIRNSLFNYGYRQADTGHTGSWGTPEAGITETLKDIWSGANPINPPSAGAYEGDILDTGASTINYGAIDSGGGSGGYTSGTTATTTDNGGTVPLEQAPDQPSIDYDAIFAPAFQALSQQEGAVKQQTEADIQSVEQGASERKAGIKSEEQQRLGEYNQQTSEAKQGTKSAIEEARRQAAEILQGIQARYGGTTGTGRFQSEILGGQATRNISTNRAALQNTLGKINQAANNLKTKVIELINNEDSRLESQKAQLRAGLQSALADIGKERGRLESEKAQMRVDAIMQYQQVLQGINQRNTQVKQQLAMQAQQAQSELEKLQARAHDNYKVNLTPSNLSSFVSSGALTPQQAQVLPIGANITGKSLDDILGTRSVTGQTPEQTAEEAFGL